MNYFILISDLSKALDCHAEKNAYLFEGYAYSKSCNPEFKDVFGRDCAVLAENEPGCKLGETPAEWLVLNSVPNKDLIYETNLQCPQCGCGPAGAIELDVFYYAYYNSV